MLQLVEGLVSIIMAAYNATGFLPDAVESVLAQTYSNWELLIIDDKSTDNTLPLALELARRDNRIRVIAKDVNAGPAAARNSGIFAAAGQYLAFLDSDDLWHPRKLQIQLEFMRTRGIGFSFTSYSQFAEHGRGRKILAPDRVDYARLLTRNVIGCLTVVLDRNILGEVPMQTIDYEDYATWLAILRQGGFAFGVQQDLALYRLSSNSVSSRKARSALWVWKIYRLQEKLPIPTCIWHFCQYAGHSLQHRITE